ncbi:MAG: coaX [Phycisphaerales bacterium]|jgi:type III pantothenate kinase|nr:coaX [Phycisphaerales bacterium]MDB5299783.1 coaX [Phycisphaerales bacterium]MDB5302844.1 coaX [Phycisphaerales bacterium]
MDINLLVLNVGNSRLAIGVFIAGELRQVKRIPHTQRADWTGVIADAWQQLAGADAAVVAASVNPALNEAIEHAVEQAAGRDVLWVGRDIDLPIPVQTDEPEKTGVDRVLNVAAAYEQMETACVVVDAGTAITVDCCNDAGEFLGGAIAPGASTMLDALHEKTAQLPRIELTVPTEAFGKNTREAIALGVYHGIRGMVKELTENYATALGQWPEVIATGGDAQLLFGGWELIHAVSPDLTLYGIALAYTNHHLKQETEG